MNGADSGVECQFRYRHLDDVIENDITQQKRRSLESPLRYKHLSDEERGVVDKLLVGGLPLDKLPDLSPRVIKLYISSAGPDTELERNVLMSRVYPELRTYCRDNHGIDFQAVDMKWSSSPDGAPLLPSTECCLREQRHCRSTSMGPHFVVLIGQKYKRYCPPSEIKSSEFEKIVEALSDNKQDVTLLEMYYREDVNVVPAVRRLERPNKKDSSSMWRDTKVQIQELLEHGAKLCTDAGSLTAEDALKYTSSVLHQEIQEGILNQSPESRSQNCFVYTRDVNDMDKLLCDTAKYKFLDFTPLSKDKDVKASHEMEKMRETVRSAISPTQIHNFDINWGDNGLSLKTHEEYLKKLCQNFFSSIKTLVDQCVEKQNRLSSDQLYNEVIQHWHISSNACSVFVGRNDILSSVKEYLLSETDQPLVICGESGGGKTSTMAKIASDINVAIKNEDLAMRTAILFRFLGQSQNSCTAQQLLYSMCHQLAYIMGKYRHEVPTDYKTLKLYFIDLVQRGEFGGMIIILLDSLNSLSTCDNGHKLEWLPSRIAQNVKIVVTANTEDKELVQRLVNKCQKNMHILSPFSSTDCENIMKVMMNKNKRSVSYSQWKAVQDAFKQCTLPVYVRFVYEEVCKWRSYDEPTEAEFGATAESVIERAFDRLEQQHGSTLVSFVLGYLTAAKDGLSESELMDILSIDDTFLNSQYIHWHPPMRRVLPYTVLKIRQDLEPFLTERQMDGILVLFWKYRQCEYVARQRYLNDIEKTQEIHSNIADYYLGKWSGATGKPFRYPSMLMAKLRLTNPDGEACRLVPNQPNSFGTTKMDERFNLRKMTQLPHSLMCSSRYDDLRSETFCNLDYLYCRIQASSLQQLLTDIDMFDDRQSALIGDTLRMSGSALALDVKSLGVELTGRLLPHIKRYPFIKYLISQCDLAAQKYCPLVPICQIYSAPGGPLQYECDVGGNIYCPVDIDVFTSEDGILLTAKPYYSSRVRVWELSRGDPRPDMMMPVGEIHPTRNGKYLNVFQNDRSIKIFKSDCGELHGEVEYGIGTMSDLEVSNKYLVFAIEKGAGPYVIDIERCALLHKFSFHTHAVAINPNDTHLVFNSGRNLILYELPLMERKCLALASDVPQDIIFISRDLICFVLTKSKMVESIFFDTLSRKYSVNSIICDLEIQECVLSHTETYLLIRSSKCLHQVDVESEKVIRKYQHLPQGVFVDPLSSFTGAGFTPNDQMIVASRYTYLAVWDAATGEPMRVLQASVSPITKMFTSDAVNKVVSLLEDNSFQVWNLENIDTDILHSNEIFPGPVKGVAVSSESGRIVCIEKRVPEAKVLSTKDGKVTDILQHSLETFNQIREAFFSPCGRYIVTRGQKAPEQGDGSEVWETLRDDIIWDMDENRKISQSNLDRFVIFNKTGSLGIIIKCTRYSRFDWSENTYNVILLQLEKGSSAVLEFPEQSEFASTPHILSTDKEQYFTCVVQFCNKVVDEETQKEKSRCFEIRLMLRDLSSRDNENIFLRLQNLLDDAPDDSQFLDAIPAHEGNLMIIYGKGVEHFTFEASKGITKPVNIEKGALLFNVRKEVCIKHITSFLNPSSDINLLSISSKFGVIMDSNQNIFNGSHFSSPVKIQTEFAPKSTRLALDGRYIIGLAPNYREVIVVRSSDGVTKGHMFVHGRATCINIGNDDRTIVVGCEDGRVMILSLILELCDPVTDLIRNFPSRQQTLNDSHNFLIKEDIRHMSCKTPDLVRLSSRIQSAKAEGRRPPSRQAISTAVMLTRQTSQVRSEACVIQ